MPRSPYVMSSSSAPAKFKAFASLAWSGIHECIERPDCHYMQVAKHKIAEAYFNQNPPLYTKAKSFEPFNLSQSKLETVKEAMQLLVRSEERLNHGMVGGADAIYFYNLGSLIRRDLTMMTFEDVMTSARLSFPKDVASHSERLKLEAAVKSVNVEHVASHIEQALVKLSDEPVSSIQTWLEDRCDSATETAQAEKILKFISHQK